MPLGWLTGLGLPILYWITVMSGPPRLVPDFSASACSVFSSYGWGPRPRGGGRKGRLLRARHVPGDMPWVSLAHRSCGARWKVSPAFSGLSAVCVLPTLRLVVRSVPRARHSPSLRPQRSGSSGWKDERPVVHSMVAKRSSVWHAGEDQEQLTRGWDIWAGVWRPTGSGRWSGNLSGVSCESPCLDGARWSCRGANQGTVSCFPLGVGLSPVLCQRVVQPSLYQVARREGKWSSFWVRTQAGALTLSARSQDEDLWGVKPQSLVRKCDLWSLTWHRVWIRSILGYQVWTATLPHQVSADNGAYKPQPKSKTVSFFFHFLRLEEGSADLRKRMSRLEEELDQEKKKYTMLEIKLRNSERAREDAEKRNQLLQREMEEFFSTLGSLTVGAKGARALK